MTDETDVTDEEIVKEKQRWAEIIRANNTEGDGYVNCVICDRTGFIERDSVKMLCPTCRGYGLRLGPFDPKAMFKRQ